jgi:4-alpha-glucanotransferase
VARSGGSIDGPIRVMGTGPGDRILRKHRSAIGALPFLAEDLGLITPDVEKLRDRFYIPGTRVLQFAFDGHEDNPYLPRNFVNNTVVYTGTHDNPTSREWFEELADTERQTLSSKYFNIAAGETVEPGPALMRLAWHSRAALAVAPLQDLLNLGREARMNVPGVAGGNWRWRCTEVMLADKPFGWLRDLTAGSQRFAHGHSYRLAS